MAHSHCKLDDLIAEIESKIDRKPNESSQFLVFCPLDDYQASELTALRCLLALSTFANTLKKFGNCSIFGLSSQKLTDNMPRMELNLVQTDQKLDTYFERLEHLCEQFSCSCEALLCLDCTKIEFGKNFIKNIPRHCMLRSKNSPQFFTLEAIFSCQLVQFCDQKNVTKIFTIFPENHQNFVHSCRIICYLLNSDIQFISFPVGLVTSTGVDQMSIEQFLGLRKAQLVQLHKTKHPSPEEISSNVLNCLLWTFIIFEFLTKSLSKNLILQHFETDYGLNSSSSSEGLKVMYNYARICSIIAKFENQVESGQYPQLKPLSDLSKENKTKILLSMGGLLEIFNFNETDVDFHKYPTLCNKMIKFTTLFSKFYRRNQILTDPSPILLENLHVKMNVLYFMKKCMKHIFDSLSIDPIEEM